MIRALFAPRPCDNTQRPGRVLSHTFQTGSAYPVHGVASELSTCVTDLRSVYTPQLGDFERVDKNRRERRLGRHFCLVFE